MKEDFSIIGKSPIVYPIWYLSLTCYILPSWYQVGNVLQ